MKNKTGIPKPGKHASIIRTAKQTYTYQKMGIAPRP